MNMQDAIESTQRSLEQIITTSKGLSPELIKWKPAEDKWSVMEVLVHMDEALPYWLDEITRLLDKPGTEWGRGLQDEKRLAALASAGQRSLHEVLASLEQIIQRVEQVLGPITSDQLQQESPSRNPRFGTKPLSFVIQHLVVDHANSHDKQIKRNIEQFNTAK
ncbi:DinB family protein [Paenibacillus fonticola]|uniref:DinB family protein n=1 Tax=Paenibacillus fonticola TaxID=379896 RepID=UPI00036FFB0E|nr:DinB family protein [Paenibacillus fonticola]